MHLFLANTPSYLFHLSLCAPATLAEMYLHADTLFLHALHKDGPKSIIRVFLGSIQEI